ncbi:hypothetical protein TthTMY_20680 [Thermus thermophilus]|nr:hypothetical protein TthTMY_20680 [Thermus thermophilus]
MLERRSFLQAAAGSLVLGLARAQGPSFPEPKVVRSQGGLLSLKLSATPTPLALAGQRATLLTYGGSFPGPTLRVRPRDTVRLTLENRLPEPTNLHWHGLPISPKVDDPFLSWRSPRGRAGPTSSPFPRSWQVPSGTTPTCTAG